MEQSPEPPRVPSTADNPTEPREVAFRLGGLLNRFDWSARQARLLSDGGCYADAAAALGEIRARLVALDGPAVERAVECVRALQEEHERTHRSTHLVAALDGLQTALVGLRGEDGYTEAMAAEREDFLAPVAADVEGLSAAILSCLDGGTAPAFVLGRLVDELVRPRGVHRHVFREEAAAPVGDDIDPFHLPSPESKTGGQHLTPAGTSADPSGPWSFVEPLPDASASSAHEPQYTGNYVVNPGELVPDRGVIAEVRGRWPKVFGRPLPSTSNDTSEDRARRLREYDSIVAQATVGDPTVLRCELDGSKRTAVLDDVRVPFGRAKEQFQILEILHSAGGHATRSAILKQLGKRDIASTVDALNTSLKRLRERLKAADAPVEVVEDGGGYTLRRMRNRP